MEEEKNKQEKMNSINRLQEELYSRNSPNIILHEEELDKKPEVEHKNITEPLGANELDKMRLKKKKNPAGILKKFTLLSFLFFLITASLAVAVVYFGLNFTSPDKVSIEIKGQAVVEGGGELTLDVSVVNENRSDLENLILTVEYPQGARNPDNVLESLFRQQESIGFVESGKTETRTFKSVLYGERQSVKTIKVLLEYKTKGSDAVLYSEAMYEVGIRSSPISVVIMSPKEISNGQEVEIEAIITSNSNTTLNNLLLNVDYPFGFSPIVLSPKPNYDNQVWELGDLEPREKREILIKGIINGQENEEKVFKFSVGNASPSDERKIGVEYVASNDSIYIRKAFITLDLGVTGKIFGDKVTSLGETVSVTINWLNNLNVDLNDAVLEVKVIGKPLLKTSVSVNGDGFYKSQNDTITWNKNTSSELGRIKPNQNGSFNFSFNTTKPDVASFLPFRNSYIDIEATMKGVRFFESEPPENVSSSITGKIKMKTDLSLASKMVYSIGPWRNTGPLPPKAEFPTTYTIVWSLSNSLNDVRNATVSATLPVYVEWVGNVSPANASLVFNPETRMISWNAGLIPAGSGFDSSPKEVYFRISFTPSLGQVGRVPDLIGESILDGIDNFTAITLKDSKPPLNTKIISDPAFLDNMAVVVE